MRFENKLICIFWGSPKSQLYPSLFQSHHTMHSFAVVIMPKTIIYWLYHIILICWFAILNGLLQGEEGDSWIEIDMMKHQKSNCKTPDIDGKWHKCEVLSPLIRITIQCMFGVVGLAVMMCTIHIQTFSMLCCMWDFVPFL